MGPRIGLTEFESQEGAARHGHLENRQSWLKKMQAFPQIRPGREVWIARQNRCKGTGAFPPYHLGTGLSHSKGTGAFPLYHLGYRPQLSKGAGELPRITLGTGLNSESLLNAISSSVPHAFLNK